MIATGWQAQVAPWAATAGRSPHTRDYEVIRRGLLAGALLLLVLSASALLATCLQQVRDARRSLAALSAIRVPHGLLARAVGWQNMIPLVLTVLLADATGIVLGMLLLPIAAVPVGIDWQIMGLMSAAALAAGAAVTVLALPTVWAVARPGGLRTE